MSLAILQGVGGGGSAPTLISKTITANGIYDASLDNADGYSQVTVRVAQIKFNQLMTKTITTVTADDLAGATRIENYAFYNCSDLLSVTIPNTVTHIGTSAFENCSSITSLSFPDSVTTISSNAYRGCSALTSVRLSENITALESSFVGTAIQNVYIPSKVKYIDPYCVFGISTVTSVTWDEDSELETLYAAAIGYNPNLVEVSPFPPSLISLWYGNFQNSGSLKKLVFRGSVPPTVNEVWNATCPIYVPYANIDTYKGETNWVAMAARIYPLVSTVADLTNIDTTTYTKACVRGSGTYDEYAYDGSSWSLVA